MRFTVIGITLDSKANLLRKLPLTCTIINYLRRDDPGAHKNRLSAFVCEQDNRWIGEISRKWQLLHNDDNFDYPMDAYVSEIASI